MQRAHLMQSLRMLAKDITKQVEAPNFGGCGIIASVVGQHLARLGIEVDIATPSWDQWGVPAFIRPNLSDTNNIHEWDDNGLSRGHLVVRFRLNGQVYSWDSDCGVQNAERWFGSERRYMTVAKFGDGLTIDEARAISYGSEEWNSAFDRAQIPLIERLAEWRLGYLY